MIQSIAGWGRLTKMCLASILYHHEYLLSLLHVNHVFLVTSHVFRNGELLQQVKSDKELIVVTFPWNDGEKAFSGIPPHVALMQQVKQINEKQSRLVTEFIAEMKATLEQMGVDGGRMSETNLKTILANFEQRFESRFGLGIPVQPEQELQSDITEMGRIYQPHLYGGSYKRVPENWRWPRCGIADLWRHWWIGDSTRQIPPLRLLRIADVRHLDNAPLTEEEKHGRTGKHKEKRRPATKVLSDPNFLMKFIIQKVIELGKFEPGNTVAAVDRMFLAVVNCFDIKDRDAQKRWTSVVNGIRTKRIT
jgi:hypothetical protein